LPAPETNPAAQPSEAKLEATAQLLTFDPGLYELRLLATRLGSAAGGLIFPRARLDPIDGGSASRARAYIAALTEGDFIRAGGHPAHVRVEHGPAPLLLTIYRIAGMLPLPELRVRRLSSLTAAAAPEAPDALPSLPVQLLVHMERSGDITVPGGVWAGTPGAGAAIEGFAVTPDAGPQAPPLEYQAMLGQNWDSPWFRAGEFCGSRGMSLPLIGVRLRLTGAAADRFACRYWGSFAGHGELGPFHDGADCTAGGPALEALRVVVVARSDVDAGATPPRGAVAVGVAPGQPTAGVARSAAKRRK